MNARSVKKPLSDLQKAVVRELTGDLPVIDHPFEPVAQKLGISQRRLLTLIKKLKAEGYIRRFGATLRHRNSGFSANAMVVWLVPQDEIDQVGEAMASFKEVTHCYLRQPQGDWKFNLFTMIHGSSQEECRAIAQRISQTTGIKGYQMLFSTRELKKITMRYFYE